VQQAMAGKGQFRELWMRAAFLQLLWCCCCTHQLFAYGDCISVYDLILAKDIQKGEKDFLLSASDVSVGPLSLRAFSLLAPAFLFSIVKSGLSSPRNQLQTASQTMAKESDDPSMQLRSVGVEFRCLHLLHSTEAVTTPAGAMKTPRLFI
jgi:hypothetical protein